MRRRIAGICACAVLCLLASPVQAVFVGYLPAEQQWTLTITNGGANDTTAVTIYELDDRGRLDAIKAITHSETVPLELTLPKPGKDAKRIIIEVEPFPGRSATVIVNGGGSMNAVGDTRLTYDVVVNE